MNDVLLIYSDFENLPKLFVFDSETNDGKLAISCNGLIINLEQEDFSKEQIEFVCHISELDVGVNKNCSGSFKHIVQCGFAP